MPATDSAARPPWVFVSYSHDSREHMDRVLALCDRLRREGVAAELDQYEPVPPEGWPLWTARKVEQADFVLIVCTETYRRRFDGREEACKGLGVRWEGAAVVQALYEAGTQNDKFLPVVFSPTDEAHIPSPLRSTTRFLVSEEDGYEQLYRYLTDQPAVRQPDLGARRALIPRPRRTGFSSASAKPRWVLWNWLAGAAVLAIVLVTAVTAIDAPKRDYTMQRETPEASKSSILRGEILDAQSQEPLAGVKVSLPGYNMEQMTREDGRYYFEVPSLGTTSIKLRATKMGYRPLNLDLPPTNPPTNHLHEHKMRRSL